MMGWGIKIRVTGISIPHSIQTSTLSSMQSSAQRGTMS